VVLADARAGVRQVAVDAVGEALKELFRFGRARFPSGLGPALVVQDPHDPVRLQEIVFADAQTSQQLAQLAPTGAAEQVKLEEPVLGHGITQTIKHVLVPLRPDVRETVLVPDNLHRAGYRMAGEFSLNYLYALRTRRATDH
jgi:hypothetical protein